MLSYELCKKLKEVGFEKEIRNGDYIWVNDGEEWVWERYDENWFEGVLAESIRIPFLSELIEACPIEKLQKLCDGLWEAFHETSLTEASGKTPEEAVANLWLALNTKK